MGCASANSTSDSSSSTATPSGRPLEQPLQLARREQLAGGVVGAGDRDRAHVGLARGGLEQRVDAAASTRTARPCARRAMIGYSG